MAVHETSRRPEQVEVAVIGGGIGGVATAVALHDVGIDAHVFERAPELREVGGAVVVREAAVDMFRRWGIAEAFLSQAVLIQAIDHRDATGALLRTSDADLTGDGEAYSVRRTDVHDALLSVLPAGRVHLGLTTQEVESDDGRAVARFDDGTHVSAGLVVGADGIRSTVRRAVTDQDDLIFSRLVVLRGMAPASALPLGVPTDRLTSWMQGERMMLTLPVQGGSMVAMDTAVTRDEPPADLWSTEVPTEDVVEHLAGFDRGLLDLIAAGTVPVVANPVFEQEPIPTWTAGRITLVGDAAHAMAPRQGQGANQAIRDAAALAAALQDHGLARTPDALAQYEAIRIGVASRMQVLSRTTPDFTTTEVSR